MKKLLALCAAIALVGFGCGSTQPAAGPANTQSYTNSQYGFGLMFPAADEVNVRADNIRQTTYLGQNMDFFASLRTLTTAAQPTSNEIAYFYADKGMTTDQFKQALEASDKNIAVKSMDPVTINGVTLTKVDSTTDSGIDKTTYLLEQNGTLIIFSVFLQQESLFDPILQTIKTVPATSS